MKSIIKVSFFFLLGVMIQNCKSQAEGSTEILNLKLCDIAPQKDVNLLPLIGEEIAISKKELNGKEYLSKKYFFPNSFLNYTIYYNEGTVIISINNHEYLFKKGEYLRLYDRDLSKGLSWMDFKNYLLEFNNNRFLICKTYPNYNEASAMNNIYFVIQINDSTKRNYYSFGSYGYCDNIIDDYNDDGILDITLINFISPLKGKKLNLVNPRGIFSAKAYSLKDGGMIEELQNENGKYECKYQLTNDNQIEIEGNWFGLH